MGPDRLLLATSGWLTLAATTLPAGSPPRILGCLVFLLVCPGAAILRLASPMLPWPRGTLDHLEKVVLTMALSLAIDALVSEGMFLAHSFSVTETVVLLAALTSVAACLPIPAARPPQQRTTPGQEPATTRQDEPR